MKKLLIIFLIAIVTADQQQQNNYSSIKEVIRSLSNALKNPYLYLVENSYWMDFLDTIRDEGRNAAIEFCVSVTNSESLCTSLVDIFFNYFFRE